MRGDRTNYARGANMQKITLRLRRDLVAELLRRRGSDDETAQDVIIRVLGVYLDERRWYDNYEKERSTA